MVYKIQFPMNSIMPYAGFVSFIRLVRPMRTLLRLIFIGVVLFSEELLALDLPKLAGNFHFTLVHSSGGKDQVGEIEITYLKDLKFLGACRT